MRPNATSLALAAALLASAGTIACAQEATDTVVHLEGGQQKTKTGGKVESADYTSVVYSAGGRKLTIPAGDVVQIQWGDADAEYARAVSALENREAATARKGFEGV